MGVNFMGFNSGMPINDIITQLIAAERKPIELIEARKAKLTSQQTYYGNVQSRVRDLFTAVNKLTSRGVTGTTMFDAMTATSSNEAIATATVAGTASAQSISLEVKTLPSQTRAVSTSGVGQFDGATFLNDLGVTSGNFTIYVNGAPKVITVNGAVGGDDMTAVLNNLATNLSGGGITFNAAIVDGKIQLTHDGPPGTTVNFGAGGDTSNFLSKTYLLTAIDNGAGVITASQRNTTINLAAGVSTAAAKIATAVTDGTFTINGVTFDTLKVDGVTSKTMNELIGEINASSTAKVTASFNMGSNTLELKAKDGGSAMIALGDSSNGGGTGNFLTAMKLINGGNSTSSQTAGTNAEFVLNGVTMYATSALVDESVHGLTGVTLNLKQAQPGTTVTLTVKKDVTSLKDTIKDIVTKYNLLISYIDQQTNAQNKAPLAGESRLVGLRNQLRSLVSSGVAGLAGTAYDSLQQVGIGTTASGGGAASAQLQFDEAKFDAAFAADPTKVEQLFVAQDLYDGLNGTAGDDNMRGIFTQMNEMLTDKTYALPGGLTGFGVLYAGTSDNDRGLFAGWNSMTETRKKDLDKNIDRAEERLEKKEKMLRQQFLAMERMIGQFQSQGNAITNLTNQLSAGK